MNYNFTARTRTALAMAREEAVELHHGFVGTEHILLGLTNDSGGVAAAVLKQASLSLSQIRTSITSSLREGSETIPKKAELPYTPVRKRCWNSLWRRRGN